MSERETAGIVRAAFPGKLAFLFAPSRYKVCYGGRGAGRSWGFARALLIKAWEQPLRILCAREIQNSILDSVHYLLSVQINLMGYEGFYQVDKDSIRGKNGSEFIFAGLRQQDVGKLKSLEGVDIAWVEEAETTSRKSWEVLIPTIRKEDSEIWVTFNPALETDETYRRFVLEPPDDAIVQKITWRDNPFLPEVLRKEKDSLAIKDYERYLNIWEGQCSTVTEGAIFGKEMVNAKDEGRLTNVPYDPALLVNTYWDLGIGQQDGEAMAIWFEQHIGGEIRIIDYLEGSGDGFPHYAKELDRKPYVYGKHWAPHDIEVAEIGSGRTRRASAATLGIRFETVPRSGSGGAGAREERIHAARLLLPRCYFDAQRCRDGLEELRRYRRAPSKHDGIFRSEPVHDGSSHAADAFGHMAIALQERKESTVSKVRMPEYLGVGGWMR